MPARPPNNAGAEDGPRAGAPAFDGLDSRRYIPSKLGPLPPSGGTHLTIL